MKTIDVISRIGIFVGAGFLLTGCVDRSYKMIGRECPQVIKYEPPYGIIKQYLHSITLYEGYETRAHFDVMCMSEDMRTIYAALHSAKVGHDVHEHAAFLAQQIEEGKERITLYVLAQVSDSSHISLSDKQSAWSLFITTASGKKCTPLSIKEIELEPEIRALFGHRYIPFKKSYKMQFAAVDLAGRPYIGVDEVATLSLAGPGMSGVIEWIQRPTHEHNATGQLLVRQGDGTIGEEIAKIAQPKERDEDYYW